MTTDYEVAEWEETEEEITLYVCSGCGLIASEIVDHSENEVCILQDWWHLNVICKKKPLTQSPESKEQA
jgi:hypothetical protein